MKRKQHVVPYGEQWAVKTDGNTRVSSVYETKSKAIDAAREVVENKKTHVIIHYRNGKVQQGRRKIR